MSPCDTYYYCYCVSLGPYQKPMDDDAPRYTTKSCFFEHSSAIHRIGENLNVGGLDDAALKTPEEEI